MKQLFFLNLLIVIALFAGCQKLDVDEPGNDKPVFSANFTVNGEDKIWQSGLDSFYMFTDFEKGTDDVFVFTGELKKENCSADCESLKIYIRDFQQLVQGDPNVEEALRLGNYEFAAPPEPDTIWQVISDTAYTLNLDASPSILPTLTPGQFSWQLANGLSANGLQVFFNSVDLALPLPVTLTVASNNAGCAGSQTRTIGKNANSTAGGNCSVQIKLAPDSASFIAETTGTAPFLFQWSTGDSSQQISIPFFSPAQNFVSVTATTANGCTSSASVNYLSNPGTLPQICSAGFSYQLQINSITVDSMVTGIVPGDTLQLGTVILEYTDALGNRYRSDWAGQNQSAFFKIESVEDFGENEFGQQTKKLKIAFSCQLAGANVAPGAVVVIEGTGVFAVAHP